MQAETPNTQFFPSARDFSVDQVNVTVNQTGSMLELTTLLKPIVDASHTRNRKTSPPNSVCFRGTRTQVIETITSWAQSSISREPHHILWVFGYAGCGKSAIAQTMAVQLAEKRRLGASFFFFRGAGDRSGISRFAATIASQIATTINGTARHIKAALKAHPGLLESTTSPITQFEYLVYNPVKAVTPRWFRFFRARKPFIIILDGLDECEDKDEISDFVNDLLDFCARNPDTPLRFLITSRVEDRLHRRLHDATQVRLLDLVDHTSDEDIAAALDAAIADARGSRVLVGCEDTWLSPQEKQTLIEHIGGSFIFLTTITKFLFAPYDTDGLTPIDRLPLALEMNPGFDGLYAKILQGSQHFPFFQVVVSTIALVQEPLSIAQIADLLDTRVHNVTNVLVSLHAIFQVPGDDHTPITLWHTSLRDFLCAGDRSGPFHALPIHHRLLAYRSILLLASSTPQLGPPAAEYSRKFALYHWRMFLETVGDDITPLKRELDEIIDYLEGTLPVAYHNVVATYFHLDLQFIHALPDSDRQHTIFAIVCALYSTPQSMPGHEFLVSLVGNICHFVMVKVDYSTSQDEWVSHVEHFHPRIFALCSHIDVVKCGVTLLAMLQGPDGDIALQSGSRSDNFSTEYMLNCWPMHLAMAMQSDPRHPAFDLVRPTRFTITMREDRVNFGLLPETVRAAELNLQLAEGTVRAVLGSEMSALNVQTWDWGPGKIFYCKPDGRSVTVYDVLHGIKLLVSCYRSTCSHPIPPGGQCPHIGGLNDWHYNASLSSLNLSLPSLPSS